MHGVQSSAKRMHIHTTAFLMVAVSSLKPIGPGVCGCDVGSVQPTVRLPDGDNGQQPGANLRPGGDGYVGWWRQPPHFDEVAATHKGADKNGVGDPG